MFSRAGLHKLVRCVRPDKLYESALFRAKSERTRRSASVVVILPDLAVCYVVVVLLVCCYPHQSAPNSTANLIQKIIPLLDLTLYFNSSKKEQIISLEVDL